MADKIRTGGAKSAISYASLHNLSEINIVKQRKGEKRSSGRLYEVERIIESRKRQDMVGSF